MVDLPIHCVHFVDWLRGMWLGTRDGEVVTDVWWVYKGPVTVACRRYQVVEGVEWDADWGENSGWLVICDLGAVFELIGATSASALAYIFPPLCYIKLSNASHKAKLPSYLCIAFGLAVMGVSLLQAILKMIRTSILLAIAVITCLFKINNLLTCLADEGGSGTCSSSTSSARRATCV